MVIVCGICQSQLEHDPPPMSTELADRFTMMKTPDTNRCRIKQQLKNNNIQDEMSISCKKNEPDIVVTQCGHIFHNSCVTEWYITIGQRKCPMCNTITPVHEMIRVYPCTSSCADSISDIRLSVTSKSNNNNSSNTTTSDNMMTPLDHPPPQGIEEDEVPLNPNTISATLPVRQQSRIIEDIPSEQNNDNTNIIIGQQQQQQRTVEEVISMSNTNNTNSTTVTTGNIEDSSTSSTTSIGNLPTTSTFNHQQQQQRLDSPLGFATTTPDPANGTIQRTERIVNNIRTIFYRFLSSSSNDTNNNNSNNANTAQITNNTENNNQPRTSRVRWRSSLRDTRVENPDHSRSPYRPCRNCSALKRVQALMEKDLSQLRNRVSDLSEALTQEKRKNDGMIIIKQDTQNEIHQ